MSSSQHIHLCIFKQHTDIQKKMSSTKVSKDAKIRNRYNQVPHPSVSAVDYLLCISEKESRWVRIIFPI